MTTEETNTMPTEVSQQNVANRHIFVFLGIITFLITSTITLGGIIWNKHLERQDEINFKQTIVDSTILIELKNVKVSQESIKKYLLLRDEVDIDEINDHHLWDELIRAFRKESKKRGIIMRDVYDSISDNEPSRLMEPYLFPLYKNTLSIVNQNIKIVPDL